MSSTGQRLLICLTIISPTFVSAKYFINHKVLDNTLILSNIIFRHGDRVPNARTYPNNPYSNASLFPYYNLGDLTRKGQLRMYNTGVHLRNRYARFLGTTPYFIDLAGSMASAYVRAQMSLQALHAGLFANSNPIRGLTWQAVPYEIIVGEQDRLIAPYLSCPQLIGNITYPNITDAKTLELFGYVRRHSGFENITYSEIDTIVDSCRAIESFGYPLPEWLKPIYPQPLSALSARFLGLVAEQKRRYGGGWLLEKITEDALAKANGSLVPNRRKLFLYAGHDFTVNFLLAALNTWVDEYIEYGAYILMELHKIRDEYGFKIYYSNNYPLRALTIGGCGEFCELTKFVELTRTVYEPPPECY